MRNALHLLNRLIAFAAVAAIIAALGAPPAGAAAGFGDVDEGQYFTEAVAWMVDEGVTTGIEPGCFGPSDDVSRGQVAAFLYRLDRALGNEPDPGEHSFEDVVATYQQEPVGWLYSTGISTGTSPTSYQPDAPITRGDFAVMLWRYAGRPGGAPPHQFTDVVREYQQPAISWMAAEKITTGTSATTFTPEGHMSRGQAATFFWRFVAQPKTAQITNDADCLRPLRVALEIGGLTPVEAACAAPFLTDFDLAYLVRVVNDEAEAEFGLILAVADLLQEGCIDITRFGELTRRFF